MQTFSQSPQTSTPRIPIEQHAALFAVINQSRLANGWLTRTAQELDPMIREWARIFDRYNIPPNHYQELYTRAFEVRANALHNGSHPASMDATLIASQWIGQNGLQQELRRRQVEDARALPSNAESACDKCLGTGFERYKDGAYFATKKCSH